MSLQDMDERGGMRTVSALDYPQEFERTWNRFTADEKAAIEAAIDEKLDTLAQATESRWGAIMNTSIEGGKVNPFTGRPGDWSGTPWAPIYEHCGQSETQAALFFGLLWKWRIIEHDQPWVGIRNDPLNRPTFQQRGVTLQGRTYFLGKPRR